MNESVTETLSDAPSELEEPVALLTRDELRAALIGKKHVPESTTVEVFGVEVELRQPTFSDILKVREEADEQTRTIEMFVNYAYVPGTDEKVFEDTDKDTILRWPYGPDITRIQRAIAELTGIDISAIEKELEGDPLAEQ